MWWLLSPSPFWQLLDGLLERSLVRSSGVEAGKAEFYLFCRWTAKYGDECRKSTFPQFWHSCLLLQPDQFLFSPQFRTSDYFSRTWALLKKIQYVKFGVSGYPFDRSFGQGSHGSVCQLRHQFQSSGPWKPRDWRAMLCTHYFVRNPLLTQRSFWVLGIALLGTAASSSGSIYRSSEFDAWRSDGSSADSIIADLKTSQEKVLLCRKTSKDTHKRLFDVDSVASKVVDEALTRTTVRISDAVVKRRTLCM